MSRTQRLKIRVSNLGRGPAALATILILAGLIGAYGVTDGDLGNISLDIDFAPLPNETVDTNTTNGTSENVTVNASDTNQSVGNATQGNTSALSNSSNSSDTLNATG